MEAGIPVVTVDADLPDSGRMAFVGTGNYNVGLQGGAMIGKLLNGTGKVAILTMPTQPNHQDRVRGYTDALAKFPNIQIVQTADSAGDPVKAAAATTGILQKYPDLAGLICTDSAGGSGAATALKEANMAGKVKVITMDRDPEILQAIKDGEITATIVQQTALMPYYAIVIMHNMKLGDFPISSDNKAAGITGAPVNIDTGTVVVDKSNVDYFMKQ
jgi:ribose transport system substrate-binding protein